MCIAKGLTLENTVRIFELSEAFSAPQLAKRCVLFVLEQYDDFVEMHGKERLLASSCESEEGENMKEEIEHWVQRSL